MGFSSITGSGFLAAFALMLGADNLQIGLLAALPFLAMPLQVATVDLVERLRRRKATAVVAMLSAQAVWIQSRSSPCSPASRVQGPCPCCSDW
ncbi:MAG: hypothetical protein HQ548_09255 [Chloroflexi bacterium]|nr:hypothetical protein [Chloroflexota bacterium]